MNRNNHPFYEWVPRPIGILILLAMFIPPTFSGGAYLCNISEMSSGLGILSEDIQLASIFTNIGMCLFPPFMVRFLQIRRIKHTYLYCFMLLIPLNFICAITTSVPILLVTCLLTGFIRIIAMLNCTFTIAPYLTGMDTLAMFTMKGKPSADIQYILDRKRTFLMPILYCFILIISQASNILTAWFAYEYQWQDAYFVVIGMLLFSILLVICTMPNEKTSKTNKVEWQKVPGMLFMAIILCSMAYILIYGKTLDWFCSESIRLVTGILLISCGAFLCCSFYHKWKAYLPLNIFTYRNVWMSMLLFILTMLFNSANNFVSMFAKLSTPINNFQNASLSGWAISGCILGLILSVLLIVKKVRFHILFSIAFMLMAASNIYLYFQYQTIGLFNNMILPTVLNYMGLIILYSVVAAFGMKRLPSYYLSTFVFLMILVRNAIAPMWGSSIYTNWLYNRQQFYKTRLIQNIDNENTLAANTFMQTKHVKQTEGKSITQAEQIATSVIHGQIILQSTIVAMKNITGQTIILLFGATGIVFLLPYYKGETT